MISFESKGNFQHTDRFLKRMSKLEIMDILTSLAQEGVRALSSATPIDSGLTASSWGYEVKRTGNSYMITWTNSNTVNGLPIAILLQYGHGTGTGGYVRGRDYINPALRPVFDRIADDVWKVVTSA